MLDSVRDQLILACIASGRLDDVKMFLPKAETATLRTIAENVINGYGADSLALLAAELTCSTTTLTEVKAIVSQLNARERGLMKVAS